MPTKQPSLDDVRMLTPNDRLAVDVVRAIRSGDLEALARLLAAHPDLVGDRIGDDSQSRSLLHIATDWPGHYPNNVATVQALVAAGAEVDARFVGPHTETPLHWAASCDDVDVLDALLDAGADIEADGAVIGGGTPLMDAVAFGQWRAARRLVERGAVTGLREAAALGLMNRVEASFSAGEPRADVLDGAFWYACHGGQEQAAAYLLERGANLDWVSPWDHKTPLEAALRSEATKLASWLRARGAREATKP